MNSSAHHQSPDFIIVGTQKGGTSSLYNCLRQHPEILPAQKKEIHYFSQYYQRPIDWYIDHFPVRDKHILSGEASPYYLFHPLAAERIAKHFPDIKILVMLRNPIHRAISHYHQQARRGHEPLTMLEAFTREKERIAKSWDRLLAGENMQGSKVQQCSYVKRGEYLEQIQRYEQHFPAQQLFILSSEEFFTHPYDTLSKIYNFLGVNPKFRPKDLWPRKPGNYEKTSKKIISYLENHYQQYNEALFKHLGKNYNW